MENSAYVADDGRARKLIAVAVVAVIAAVAAAGFAVQRILALAETKAELASANSQLQKAKDDLAARTAEATALRKEVTERKLTMDQSRAELATAQGFLDAEKAIGVRLREELKKAKEDLALMSKGRPVQAPPKPMIQAPGRAPRQPGQ